MIKFLFFMKPERRKAQVEADIKEVEKEERKLGVMEQLVKSLQERIEQQDQKIKELNNRLDKLYEQLHEQERVNNALVRENNELRLALKEAEHNVCVRPETSVSKAGCQSGRIAGLKNSLPVIMMPFMMLTKKKRIIIMMKITEYLKSLIKSNTGDSSKSFVLLLTCAVGALVGLCVCFCLVWDVCTNGYLKTDLGSLGLFVLCVGGFMAGGGVNKVLGERLGNKGRTDKNMQK